jgi:hypothetical protein
MPPNLLHVLHLMRQARERAFEEGMAVTFPFYASDVEALHTCSHKHGRGVYFRLRDGRVFSALGAELDPNPACYDSGAALPGWVASTTPPCRPARSE